jgi:hypothetical protein
MSDSVDVIESKRNRDAVESRIDEWLTNNSGITSLDHIKTVYEMNDRVGIAMIYTA